jgi:hypothetical protein
VILTKKRLLFSCTVIQQSSVCGAEIGYCL